MKILNWPKIPLGLRVFFLYFIFVIFCAYIVIKTVTSEIKPGVRQSTEETLIDMANLIAVLVTDDVKNNTLIQSKYPYLLSKFNQLQPKAAIWGINKTAVNHRIYITDDQGVVILDSSGQDLGANYSQWNDVYLTLKGQYGARSTRSDPDNELSSVMHVAAPIIHNKKIIGVVTVAKPNSSMQPFIERSKNRLISWSILLGVLAIIIGAVLSWRITKALSRLSYYAEQVTLGNKIPAPKFRIFYEFGNLAQKLEKMRTQLEGKNYAEHYVQTLTHELKSPLAAIKGATEILQSPLNDTDKNKFINNIENENERLQQLIDRMLNLSIVEQQQIITHKEPIDLALLVDSVLNSLTPRIIQKNITITRHFKTDLTISGDKFLLQQALFNLIENALDFTPKNGNIKVTKTRIDNTLIVTIENSGDAIPDYAIHRICERFYSLPRPDNGRKSTGLGLNFVSEVAKLHLAKLLVTNTNNGVSAQLLFELNQ